MNKDRSSTTNACDDSSIDVATQNILLSSLVESPNPTTDPTTFTTHSWTIGFSTSKSLEEGLLH
jgi:hypothetical protein